MAGMDRGHLARSVFRLIQTIDSAAGSRGPQTFGPGFLGQYPVARE